MGGDLLLEALDEEIAEDYLLLADLIAELLAVGDVERSEHLTDHGIVVGQPVDLKPFSQDVATFVHGRLTTAP